MVTYRRFAREPLGEDLETAALPANENLFYFPAMGTPVIVEAIRTPLGRRRGWLAGVHPAVLLGHALTEVLARSGLDPAEVDQVIGGCVTQAGEQSTATCAVAWLNAGLPERVGATTIDAQCGSAQQAVHMLAAQVAAGSIDVGIACGVEAMCRVPLAATSRPGSARRAPDWRSTCPPSTRAPTGSPRRGLGRADLDAFGLTSRRARTAWDEGRLEEITPVIAPCSTTRRRHFRPGRQGLRETSMEALAGLQPIREDGLHTAGTSSQISDGAVPRW